MKRHYRTVHAGTSVPCEVCGQVFQSELRLKDHMRGVHNKVPCSICHEMIPSGRKYYHMQQSQLARVLSQRDTST